MEPINSLDHLRLVDPLSAWWVALVVFIVMVIIAITNVSSPRKWRILGQALFRMRLGKQTLREDIDLQDRTLLGLLFCSVLIMGMFAWQVFIYLGIPGSPSYPTWVLLITAVVIIQSLALRAAATIMRVDSGLGEHLYSGLMVFILAGLVLLPLSVLIAYRPEWRYELLIGGGVVTVLLLLFRWIRGVWIGIGEGVPVRYIIIYLCTTEILPLLLLVDALRRPIPSLINL